MTSLSQRRSSLLEAVGGGARRATLVGRTPSKAAPKRASPARTAIPVKPPVVKSKAGATASRIPVTKTSTASPRGGAKPADVPAPLSDLSWKFSSDSRPTSPDAASGKAPPGGRGRPPIRPKTSSLRRPGPAPSTAPSTATRRDAVRKDPPASKPGPSAEDQAIHDLQELVRRQQEELEEYQHPEERDNHASEPSSLASCSLVQRVAKAVDAEVVVEAVAYDGPLQVKTVRLEDQDTASDVLQDPRLAATRSRLNQRLQHLLDDDDGKVHDGVVGEVSTAPDPRRRSVFLSETTPSVADAADWEPQPLAGPAEGWPGERAAHRTDNPQPLAGPAEGWPGERAAHRTDTPQHRGEVAPEGQRHAQHQPSSVTDWRAMRDDAVLEAPSGAASHKDLYHQEIRQLLKKLNADEAVFPYGIPGGATASEPIYATANKRKKTAAGPPPGEGGEGLRQGHDDVVRTSISPLKQKAADSAADAATAPAPVHPQDAGLAQLAQLAGLANMRPLSDEDGDGRQPLSPGSDLSLCSSSGNTSGDDGIGDEQRSPWAAARGRCRDPARGADASRDPAGSRGSRDSRDRDLSMDSGIQGSSSSCELDILDSSGSTTASSASDAHEDDADVADVLAEAPERPAPIGGCERQTAPPVDEAAVEGVLPEGEAFKVVEELYVADAAVSPTAAVGPAPSAPSGPRARSPRMFTETHFDSAPNLGPSPLHAGRPGRPPFSSAPVGLDSLDSDRDAGLLRLQGLQGVRQARQARQAHQGVGDEASGTQPPAAHAAAVGTGLSSVVSLPKFHQIAVEGLSASTSNLLGPQTLLSPPEPFRRPQGGAQGGAPLREGAAARQSKRFSSADDVFRASLLRHSLPAKPPRTPSVRASLEEDLSSETFEASPATTFMPSTFPSATDSTTSPRPAPAHHVVVAIDFGTTYSGYAFCYTRDADCNIHMMRKWEGGDPGLYNEKAPTVLLLTPEGKFHSFGFLARDTFHDLHPDQAKRWLYFDKFKMALLSQTTLTRDTTLAAANGRQVAALTVLSMSLAHLRDRALAELAAADQGDSELCFLGDESVRWVLTVPALWGPSATQLLREAAHMAGLASPHRPEALLIVLEPEAASLYCRQLRLHQLHQHQLDSSRDHSMASLVLDPHGHGVRTQYMVVDCGGGTVDITVHELSGQRATLRELHKASGGACGSLGVDREFERLLSSVFGADFMSHFRRKRPAAYVELLLSFEARKRSAEPDRDRDANLTIFPPFAFVEAYRKFRGKEVEHAVRKFGRPSEISWSSQGMLRLSPKLMADLFQPTLDQVCHQVDEVLRSPRLRVPASPGTVPTAIQYLFLVGGFAQSLMLQHRVRSQFGSRVKVVVPQAVGLTTLRGAVLYGLDPELVASRRSKHTIGVGVLKRFQPGEHPQDKLVTLSDGSKWCCDVLDVLVVADQPLGPGEAVTRSYTPASARQTNIIIHIYCSSDASPPKFVTDAGVTRCGTLRLSLEQPEQAAAATTREIVARIEFGGTELAASAQDMASGRCVRTHLDFLSTAV